MKKTRVINLFAGLYEVIAFILGGPCGIVLSIIVHKRWFKYKYGREEIKT